MRKICLIGILLCAVMISSTSPAFAAADWVWMYSDHLGTRYVDNNSIRRDADKKPGYVFHAFLKDVYTEAGKDDLIERMRSQGITGIQNVASMTYLQYYKEDNNVRYYATAMVTFHDANGIEIKKIKNNTLSWQYVVSGTVEELKFDNIRARVPN